MRMLAAGVDTTVIALWPGHESVATTQIYIHADLAIKEKAIARTAPLNAKHGRYQPPTRSWRSSSPCDYAARRPASATTDSAPDGGIGITTGSS